MSTDIPDISKLPTAARATAAESKYARAVEMYAASRLSVREIARRCGVSAKALGAHIQRHHRELLLARHGLDGVAGDDGRAVKVKRRKGQSLAARLKYKDAIEACDNIDYIGLNVSQVARLFGLNPSALASQLRVHYPGVIERREAQRRRLGIADNTPRGARETTALTYAEAVTTYRDSTLTIPEVARQCGVSAGGLCQYMRFYHKDILEQKARSRQAAAAPFGSRVPGEPSASGGTYGPRPATAGLYSQAVELYRSTALTIEEIACRAGVSPDGLKDYLTAWHRDDARRRREAIPGSAARSSARYLPSAAAKYAPAIAWLRDNPVSIAEAARRFGLNAEVFRQYLREHEPGLAGSLGMARSADGKLVKRSSAAKYAAAVSDYASSPDPLKAIALRHGLAYNSLYNYIIRNCPDERLSHSRLVEQSRPSAQA